MIPLQMMQNISGGMIKILQKIKFFLSGILLSLLLTTHAQASNTFRIDDSGSQPIEAQAQLKWKTEAPRGRDAYEAGTITRVNIKLNTQPWQGRSGRIYMALPPIANGQLSVAWTTQGSLQAGSLVSGGRGLVYQGRVGAATMEDIMTVQISADGRLISAPKRLQFYFEFELN